ncbi:transporter substrate-binding domain-containing protein [uncultured Thiodictyon sp.]|uniref:transporter substrate-binding domain-containing protein n=1 Tax=uncultured Thiodictyon sp. TaxID=1846217 RepID=UPI0025D3F888|nr:transporter substrate-binding domain-containing protein [uncultured Thiodictyon sp.]
MPLLAIALLWLLVQDSPCLADTGASTDLLSAPERAWLAAHPRIVLGVGSDWAPWVIPAGNGRITGYAADHLQLLETKLGIRIELQAGPWHEMVQEAEAGRLDGLTLAAALPERRDHFNFTADFHTAQVFVYRREGDPLAAPGLAGLTGRRVGYLSEVLRERKLLATQPSIEAVPFPSQAALAQALLTGTVDAAIGSYGLEYWRASNGVLGFAPSRMLAEGPARLGISIRKDWPELVGILNKGLAAITEAESAALNRRWFGRSDALRSDPSQLDLTPEEQAWIAAHPVVRVGIDPRWAPVEFIDEQRRPQGISVAYLGEMALGLGLRFEFVPTASWSQTLQQFDQGRLDLLPATAVTPARRQRFELTEPYLTFPAAIFSAADVAYLGGIEALRGKVVAVVDAESVHEWLRERHPDIRLLPVPDTPAALRAVTSGEAFAFVGNLATTSYYIGAAGRTEIKVLGETPFVYRLGMAVHRDAPVLRAILQKGLDALPRHDRDAIYHNWVSIRYRHETDLGLLWRALAAAAMLTALIGWWALRLSREVARRRRAEVALVAAKEVAEAANRAKGTFLTSISHELRTPLNLVLGFAALLHDLPHSERERGWVRSIGAAGKALAHQIDDLLDLARGEAGALRIRPGPVDLHGLLGEVAAMFSQRAANQGLALRVQIDPRLPAVLRLDAARVRQVLVNLVGNAVKFTQTGAIEVSASVAPPADAGARLRLAVTDSGPGIAPAERERIFEPFTQGAAARLADGAEGAEGAGGAGLGLAISRRLALAMGGNLQVQCAPGGGSTFVLELPAEAAVMASAPPRADLPAAPGSALGPAPPPARILIVDDSAPTRALLKEILGGLPGEPLEAGDGAQALALATARPPDLILLDIGLPRMDGIATCRALKGQPATRAIPVVFLTGRDDEPGILDAFKAGAADYVVKPFEPRILLARVRTHLALATLSRGLERRLGERTQALRDANARLRRLALDLSLLKEAERAQLASELHDSPMQKLALAQLQLGSASRGCDREASQALLAGIELLREGIAELRTLQFDLSPPVLEQKGLPAALEWLAASTQARWGIPMTYTLTGPPPALGRELSVILFQSARELVYNLIKHAQARRGGIKVATDSAGLRLSVEDDGVGFAVDFTGGFALGFAGGSTGRVPGAEVTADPGPGGRFGLYSVRERIALLGGRLDIAPLAPGSRVTICLPQGGVPGVS